MTEYICIRCNKPISRGETVIRIKPTPSITQDIHPYCATRRELGYGED